MVKKILGIVGWLGTALVLAAVVVRFTLPGWESTWRGLVYAGLVCALLYMLSQWREVAGMFAGRSARYGSLASASILIVIGLLAGINYVAARQNKRWDLTSSKQYTLSEQTQKVLRSLQTPVTVRVFEKEPEFDRFRSRLAEYEYITDKLTVEYIDPDKKPGAAKQYQIQSYGTVLFDHEGRLERVTSDSEQELTNALIKVVEGKQKKVYFVQGHGEKDTGSAEREGYSAISSALPNQNFAVDKLVLAQTTAVPDDASVLVLAGPRTDLLQPEVDALKAYLKKGGKLLFLIDPPQPETQPLANISALLKEWAIEVGNDVVVDISGMGQLIGTDASVPIAASYPSHPITQDFGLLTAYPLARSVSPTSGGANGRFAQTFIETGPRSWSESDIKALLTTGKVALDEAGGDKRGPISVGVAVSAAADEAPKPAEGEAAKQEDAPKPESRIATIGDSDFAANNFLGVQGNRDLFFNTLNWLAQQENLIAIAPKDPEDRRLTLTADQQQRLFYLSVLLIPGMILGTGVYTWWRRR